MIQFCWIVNRHASAVVKLISRRRYPPKEHILQHSLEDRIMKGLTKFQTTMKRDFARQQKNIKIVFVTEGDKINVASKLMELSEQYRLSKCDYLNFETETPINP